MLNMGGNSSLSDKFVLKISGKKYVRKELLEARKTTDQSFVILIRHKS